MVFVASLIYLAYSYSPVYNRIEANGKTGLSLAFLLAGLSLMLIISRRGYPRAVAYGLTGLVFMGAIFTGHLMEAAQVQTILLFSLAIVMAGALINSVFSLAVAGLAVVTMIGYNLAEKIGVLPHESSLAVKGLKMADELMIGAIFLVIALITWLFNREIERALIRARASEAELLREKKMLQTKVYIRSKEIEQMRLSQMENLYRFADLGKLAGGLIHDLVNPLSVISLNLEQAEQEYTSETIAQAKEATGRLEEFVKAVRQQIRGFEIKVAFCPASEVNNIFRMLKYKANEARVELKLVNDKPVILWGSPHRFNQLMSNLVVNAIEAYDEFEPENGLKEVAVKIRSKYGLAMITVADFGSGISNAEQKRVFDPFFTTKAHGQGTGVGLAICQLITEKHFNGRIEVKSKPGQGTIFSLKLPRRQE